MQPVLRIGAALLRATSSNRFRAATVVALAMIALATLTRIGLSIYAWHDWDGMATPLQFMAIGLFYDLVTALYFVAPFVLYLTLVPERIFRSRLHLPILFLMVGFGLFLLVFTLASEFVFWNEFNSRFNFLAVDYLIYTREVIGNIRESYPMPTIFSGLIAAAALLLWRVRHPVLAAGRAETPLPQRGLAFVAWFGLTALSLQFVNGDAKALSDNPTVNELSGNGIYEFFAAARNNELDYERLYYTIDSRRAFGNVRTYLSTPDARFDGNGQQDLAHDIVHSGPERKLNVILISVESLSADFLGVYGNTQNLTPNLDRLSKESLFFTRLYANGTRTVRGLEALSLAWPPTPGQAIVRRPNNERMDTLGAVFNGKGYISHFLYGGYGYFDNMNHYFANNGYKVTDRTELTAVPQVRHENVWGVADEDLYTQALAEFDASHNTGKPFFAHIMTTSNHRPYTFPANRIDLPQGSREAAVKYTDWAIGDFIERAKARPWFKDTLFVLTADHCASAAGKTELPIAGYHIPLMFYAPGHIKPARVERLMSQVDLAPTLLGQLDFSYRSHFLGADIFTLPRGRERAFIATYEKVGYLKPAGDGYDLVILGPNKSVHMNHVDAAGTSRSVAMDPQLRDEAVSWYQSAAELFDRHQEDLRAGRR